VYSFFNFFLQSLIHSRFHPRPSLLITYYSYKPFPKRLFPPSPFPLLYFTSPHSPSLCFVHFTSLYCTSLPSTLDNFSLHFKLFTSLDSASLHFIYIHIYICMYVCVCVLTLFLYRVYSYIFRCKCIIFRELVDL